VNKGFHITFILAWIAIPVIFCSIAGAQATVQLYDIVYMDARPILLGDVADLDGEAETLNRLRQLSLDAVINPDDPTVFTAEKLAHMLPNDMPVYFCGAPAVEIIPWSKRNEFSPVKSAIQRRYEILAGDSLTVQVEIGSSISWLAENAPPPQRFRILRQERLIPGSQVVTLESLDGRGKIRRRHVNVKVSLFARLAFPKALIKRGQILKRDDIEVRTVDLKTVGLQGHVLKPDCILGLEASRHLSPSEPIRWDQLRQASLVRKGDGVELVVNSDYYAISTAATALQDGAAGEQIWVRLKENGKRLRAVVVDADHVSLE